MNVNPLYLINHVKLRVWWYIPSAYHASLAKKLCSILCSTKEEEGLLSYKLSLFHMPTFSLMITDDPGRALLDLS